jgi:hypothetical protein
MHTYIHDSGRVRWGQETNEALKAAGVDDMEWRTYQGLEHDLAREEIAYLKEWIKARLDAD